MNELIKRAKSVQEKLIETILFCHRFLRGVDHSLVHFQKSINVIRADNNVYVWTTTFMAALVTRTTRWLTDEEINKTCSIPTMQTPFSPNKEGERDNPTLMNLEDAVLSDISQTQKDKYYVMPPGWVLQESWNS